jgi:hypothetical protein
VRSEFTFDPHAADIPVLIQDLRVNVFGMFGVGEVGVDYEMAEVYLGSYCQPQGAGSKKPKGPKSKE